MLTWSRGEPNNLPFTPDPECSFKLPCALLALVDSGTEKNILDENFGFQAGMSHDLLKSPWMPHMLQLTPASSPLQKPLWTVAVSPYFFYSFSPYLFMAMAIQCPYWRIFQKSGQLELILLFHMLSISPSPVEITISSFADLFTVSAWSGGRMSPVSHTAYPVHWWGVGQRCCKPGSMICQLGYSSPSWWTTAVCPSGAENQGLLWLSMLVILWSSEVQVEFIRVIPSARGPWIAGLRQNTWTESMKQSSSFVVISGHKWQYWYVAELCNIWYIDSWISTILAEADVLGYEPVSGLIWVCRFYVSKKTHQQTPDC